MALSATVRLRLRLGESIPEGGTAADTMFSDEQIQDFLDQAGGDQNKAALLGWEAKAAEFANLVTVAEGNSSRQMSDLHKNALEQLEQYRGVVGATENNGAGPRRGNAVIGSIAPRVR